jgi:hypothetical protein
MAHAYSENSVIMAGMEQTLLLGDADELSVPVLSFFVAGKPQTAGSKTGFVNKHTGKVVVTDGGDSEARARKREWRTDVRAAAELAIAEIGWRKPDPEVALWLRIAVVRARPSGHLGTGRNAGVVKDSKRSLRPTARPDTVKIVRAAEDALTKLVWHDDSQVVSHILDKVFGDQWDGNPYTEGLRVNVGLAHHFARNLALGEGGE